MADLDMLAYTSISGDKRERRLAKREMKRRFGYRQGQIAMTRVRQGLMLLAPVQPDPPKEMTVHQAIDWGTKDATVMVTNHKDGDLFIIDECTSVLDLESYDAVIKAMETTILPTTKAR